LQDDFFLTEAWFETLLAHGLEQRPQQVFRVPVEDAQGQALGCLPMMHMGSRSPLVSISNYYTGLYGPQAARQGAAWASADWLRCADRLSSLPGSEVIQIQPVDPDEPFLVGLREGLTARHYATDLHVCFGNWYLPHPVGASYAAYWEARPSRLRHTVERARRRLTRHHQWSVDLIQQPGARLDRAIEAFELVYAGSWKPAEPRPEFMPALIRMAAAAGSLRLGLLYLDGAVVAAQVWLVSHEKACIFKLAYLPGHEKLSVGSVLTTHLMQHVMDVDRVKEVDFLSGDDDYKRDWMSHRRERVGLIAFKLRSPRGLVAALRHVAGRLWRQLKAQGASMFRTPAAASD
jgi:Acetyltransferase (GNAT) domain